MKKMGNPIEFHALEGAGHYIWFGKYAEKVSEIRKNFLIEHGFE
jgi:hypothetical protein